MTYKSMADLTRENDQLRARIAVLESERRLGASRKYDETDMALAVSAAKVYGMSLRERSDAIIRARHERDASLRRYYAQAARSANRWVVINKAILRRAGPAEPRRVLAIDEGARRIAIHGRQLEVCLSIIRASFSLVRPPVTLSRSCQYSSSG